MTEFKPGDKVAYAVEFLENIDMCHSEVAHYRGVVQDVSIKGDRVFASVKWDDGSVALAAVGSLAIVGPNMRFCKC